MTGAVRALPFEPFFLPAAQGKRFCIFHPAAGTPRGAVLYIHPFAEEMNKARRMVALQSRALAAEGFSVLQIDLYGCGDSSGDFAQARWEAWQQDVTLGVSWLSARAGGRIFLWGLRLGAMLALDAAPLCDPAPAHFVLWQPVTSGEVFLTQFLRLRLASEMLSEGKSRSGLSELRAQLATGQSMEIAGYGLSSRLAARMDELNLQKLPVPPCPVHWFEVTAEMGRPLPPAAQRVAESWTERGVDLHVQCVQGPTFWNTVETTECPELLSATTRFAREVR